MAPSPCLPTGQAETLPPLPKLTRLSTLRRKSQGTNQAKKETCVPCVDTQSSVSGQMASDLSTDAHGTTPILTVPHRNHTEQVVHAKASYMQQRISPVRSQGSLNFTGYVSPSGITTSHISSQHAFPSTQQEKQPTLTVHHRNTTEQVMHTNASYMQQRIPPVGSREFSNFKGYFSPSGYATNHLPSQHTLPSTQQEKQHRLDSSQNVSSQHNEWRRQMQLQHSQGPHPRHRNAHHSYGHDYRSSLHKHYQNYSQSFGNASHQAHGAGREDSHQSRLPHQHQFSRQGVQLLHQDPMQMYRQNGPALQYHCQNQIKREENHRQYQSLQVYKQQNQDQNHMNRTHQYYMQMYQQNGQKQYGPDLQYNGRHQVQMGEKHRVSQTEEHPMNMKAYGEQNQYRDYIKHWLKQVIQSKTQVKELPQQTNQQLHNQQGVGGSSEQRRQDIHRLLHYKNQEKANESCPKGNANVAGSPKNDNTPPEEDTHSPPILLNANPQSQVDPPPGKTDENHTQHDTQMSHDIASTTSSVSENLEQTTMVDGHTLLSAETFLSYLKTSAAEEDPGGNTRTPASAPHSCSRVNTKTGASVRFIDLLEDDEPEDGEDAIVSPRRPSASTDHEIERDYYDELENNAQFGSPSPVYKQVDRNSCSENSFTDYMQSEMDRETHTDVTELDGSFQSTNMLKPSESIPTLVGCDTPYYSDPTTLECRERKTEKCKHPKNNALIRPSYPVYKQGEDNAVDMQREIIEETHTSSYFLRESAPTVIDCVTPASNPVTAENHEEEIGIYDESENDIMLCSSSPVHKQADRNLHTIYNLNDEGNQSSNTPSGNVEIRIPQCVSFPSAEAPPQSGSFQPASMLDPCVIGRLTPPDSNPPTPEKHEKETAKCRDTEEALPRSSSLAHKRSDENTHLQNNVSENAQTEQSGKVPTSPEFLSDNLKLDLTCGVFPQSVDATPQSGNFRTANESKPYKNNPRFIVRAAPPKRDPNPSGNGKCSIGYKSKTKRHYQTPKISVKVPTLPADDCASSACVLTPSTPEANDVNVFTPLTNTYVTSAYTFPSPCISTSPVAGSVTPVHTITSEGPYVHPIEVPSQVAGAVAPADTGVSTLPSEMPSPLVVAHSQTVQEYSPAQLTEVSIPSVDANKPPIRASEPSLQAQETSVDLSYRPADNPSPSQVVHKLPIHAHKLPELVPIRRARRKICVPEHPSHSDFASIRNSPEENEKTQSCHSEVYATGVPRMDRSHNEQIWQKNSFTARIQEGSEAPDRQSIEGIFHRKTSQDDYSAIERHSRCTPDQDATRQGIESSCRKKTLQDNSSVISVQPAPSAQDGAESDPSHHEQIMQRYYSINAQDASVRQNIYPIYRTKTSQESFPSISFQFNPNAKEKPNVITDCLVQAFSVSDSTSNHPVPRTPHKHESETSHLKQQMVNHVAIFMNAPLFLNASERPKLETTVQCLTCNETVEGEEACNHMFFGQLKCEKCDEIIASCKDLQRTLSSNEMCKNNSRRPHRYTDWNVPPIDFLCYRLRKRETEKEAPGVPTFLSTLEAMARYLEILSPLKNLKLWRSALRKCQAFTTMMLTSSRQQEDRKKRQKSQNTTEKKKNKTK